MKSRDRFRGCLVGLAAGDAVGMPLEGHDRERLEPVTTMTGGGPFNRPPGHWTDDTAMAICLGESLIESDGFDARDQIERYLRWAQRDLLGETGTGFDIGMTIADALVRFQKTQEPFAGSTDPQSAGNGCIMRLAPVPMYFFPDLETIELHSAESSRTTHGTPECVDACRLLGRMVGRALGAATKEDVLLADADSFAGAPRIEAIARGEYLGRPEAMIHGSGYVVECLEAALWCFERADGFVEAVLTAANLGEDADTTAAVCGQIAGAFYGFGQIPEDWLDQLLMREELERLADRLMH